MARSNLKLVAGNDDIEPSSKSRTIPTGEYSMTEVEKRLTRLETDNEHIKKDLSEIKSELKEVQKSQQDLRIELKTETANLRADIANVRTDFQKEIHLQTKWIMGTAIALVSLSLAAAKYLLN